MFKAALGGGGYGMRIVGNKDELKEAYELAKSEAKVAFGSDEVYVEKSIENPKHNVQVGEAIQPGDLLVELER